LADFARRHPVRVVGRVGRRRPKLANRAKRRRGRALSRVRTVPSTVPLPVDPKWTNTTADAINTAGDVAGTADDQVVVWHAGKHNVLPSRRRGSTSCTASTTRAACWPTSPACRP
jgi:hypothetical protein